MDKPEPSKVFLKVFFLFYILLLVLMHFIENIRPLIFKHYDGVSHNLIPFSTILKYVFNLDQYEFDTWFVFLFGNLLAFIPVGFLAPLALRGVKKIENILFLIILISIPVELIQYITVSGVLDIDDIIKSLFGGVIGFYLARKLYGNSFGTKNNKTLLDKNNKKGNENNRVL